MLLLKQLSLNFSRRVSLKHSTSLLIEAVQKLSTSTTMSTSSDTPVLAIPQGQLRGVKRSSIYDETYYSFEKIPFAKPPVGELRFRAPQPAESWQGIRDCSTFADKPVQKNIATGQIEGTEDCLYLNVYAKTLQSEKPLPVMVWIYGGGFRTGVASRDSNSPDYFMHESVVLVTFNYRLCSLGFLSLKDPELQVPGNAGLKDQVMALKWIKQNICCFNGDANNITVFGESAGASSAHYMTVTDQTKGLFHKAILMSGCILHSWSNAAQEDFAYRLAKQNGYAGENQDREVLTYLCGLEPGKLVTHNLLTEAELCSDYLYPFAPTQEPYVSEDCVLPEPPLAMLKKAWSKELPMMLGGTSFEGLVMYPRLKMAPAFLAYLKANPECVLPGEIRLANDACKNKELAMQLLECHFGHNESNKEQILNFCNLFSYKHFWHGIHRTVLSRLAIASAPTYLYRFDFDSPDFNHHRIKFCGKDIEQGVAHADDLSYLFFSKYAWKLSLESAEFKTITRMIGLWTAFAKSSDPNCEQIKPIVWQPLQQDAPSQALNISHEIEVITLPEATKLELWDSLYKKEHLF